MARANTKMRHLIPTLFLRSIFESISASPEMRHLKALAHLEEAGLVPGAAQSLRRQGDGKNGSDVDGWAYNRWWSRSQEGNPEFT